MKLQSRKCAAQPDPTRGLTYSITIAGFEIFPSLDDRFR